MEADTHARTDVAQSLPAGTFRPGVPLDTGDVVRLWAVAAKVVCAQPEALEQVSGLLSTIAALLVAPERNAADECARMWQLFNRVARVPKEALRQEAGRAFCRDLDALAQRLDLPPLPEWQELPHGIDEPGFSRLQAEAQGHKLPGRDSDTLATVRQRARALWANEGPRSKVPAHEAAQLLAALNTSERRQLLDQMIGGGQLGRSDVNLLVRYLVKGGDIARDDRNLIDVLERLGRFLAQ